ncbi:aryl-sulfate sulfotransferase N-terminal domain-containing protein [Sphingobacterium sp. SG20118]|uniref:aryl-sulfate sulfotransferase N-terminal domain-containing protein n=1 Tax=Sphingobacterium sp. SG20118 TaxID=3367156 RepID=UPI0037DFC89C
MLTTRIYSYLKKSYIICHFIFIMTVISFYSCRENSDIPSAIPSQQSLSEYIDKGVLLLDIAEAEGNYIFNFENGSVRIPLQDITKIVPEPELWRTKVAFSDGSELIIPTKGTSLDHIVEKVKLNPSGYNPLAALVDVWLPTYGRVKVTIMGKNDPIGTITHLCQENAIRQRVPILGLYADYDNLVELTFTDMEGKETWQYPDTYTYPSHFYRRLSKMEKTESSTRKNGTWAELNQLSRHERSGRIPSLYVRQRRGITLAIAI